MRHASLFSGIGGPEVAAAMLGWDNVFHCEINEFGRKVLEYWFPESDSYDDITKTDFRKYEGTIDVLTGGFPCQPFSYAGKRGGQEDQRYLWPEMLRVINEIRPTWVIGENVAGIGTMVEQCRITDMGSQASLFEEGNGIHRYTAEFAFTIERICSDLESVGYSIQPMLIPACAVGAPHRRDRIFFIAHNDIASDTINQGSLRDSGTNATKEGKERISERNKVQWFNEPADARSEIPRIAENAMRYGLQCGQEGEQGSEWNKRNFSARDCQRICGEERIAIVDNNSRRLQRSSEGKRERRGNNAVWEDRSLLPNKRWETFPTVSAVHRGNDGISFDVDKLSISIGRWRTESIKAYGNAIVPQVMYRIFEAIEVVEANGGL